ncbi:MAG: GNAT family N-acetyltransferase [Candidatus Villigracilaceae bacterium]
MAAPQIRPAVSTDLPYLMGMEHTCTSDYVWQVDVRSEASQTVVTLREVRLPRSVPVKYPRDPFALADEWKRSGMLFVALLDEQLAGYIYFHERLGAGAVWVTDVVTASEFRRRGVASALLSTVYHWSAERGYQKIFVETLAKNYPAVCLLQKNKYEFCGYNDQYYATHDVALFFGASIR